MFPTGQSYLWPVFCYTDFVARFATGRVVTRLPRGVLSLRFPLRSS